MTDLTNLKPCPFCGSHEILEFGAQEDSAWATVECRGCRATTHAHRSLEDAINQWNTRTNKPVSVSLEKCANAAARAGNIFEDEAQVSPADWIIAKAVLDAAGVAYVDLDALRIVKQKLKDNHDIGHHWIWEYERAKKPVFVSLSDIRNSIEVRSASDITEIIEITLKKSGVKYVD